MLKKKTVETALSAQKDRLAEIDKQLAAAQQRVGQLAELRLVTVGQVDALTHVLSEEPSNA